MNFGSQALCVAPAFLSSIAEIAAQPRVRHGDKFAPPKGWRWAFAELVGVMSPELSGPLTDRLLHYEASDSVDGVIMFVDSPGGTVSGTPELAEAVRRVAQKKPIHIVAENYLASGALWVASQATTITASPSTLVGSIGVIHVLVDDSEYFKQLGVKVIAISSSGMKTLGVPGVAITEEHLTHIRWLCDFTTAHFEVAIKRGRKLTDEQLAAVANAGVWYASTARHLRLIDDVQLFPDAMGNFLRTNPPEQYAELSGRAALEKFLAIANTTVAEEDLADDIESVPGSTLKKLSAEFPHLTAEAKKHEVENRERYHYRSRR